MKRTIAIMLFFAIVLTLLSGCSQTEGDGEFMPVGDVDVTVQYLPEKVDNPENLPVLKWLCLTDFGQGGGQGRVWNETAVHQLNDMLAQRNMPYRIQFVILTNDSSPGYYNWFDQKEVKKLIKEADLVYGSLTADEMAQYLMPITDYATGKAQPTLEKAVPYEQCWASTKVGNDIYGIRGIKPFMPQSLGWYVSEKIIDEYGLTVEDFQGKYFWEMDDAFAGIYEKNGNLAFITEDIGGTVESGAVTEDSAKKFIPSSLSALLGGRFESIGAFFALDYGQETPKVVNLLESEYVRCYQEAIIRYADAGYLQAASSNLIFYGSVGIDTVCKDGDYYCIPVEPLYIAGGANGPTSGICAATKHAEEALSLLALIGNDENFRMQLAYGKEGQDYTITEDGYYRIIKREDKTTYSLDFLFSLNYFSGLTASVDGNDYMYSPTTRHSKDRIPEGKSLLQALQESSEICKQYYPYSPKPLNADCKSNELSFHYESMKQELEKIQQVSNYYFAFFANPKDIKDNPNTKDEDESKPRMTKEKYDEMLQALRDAGSDKILAELQRQLDAWLAENPDWNK